MMEHGMVDFDAITLDDGHADTYDGTQPLQIGLQGSMSTQVPQARMMEPGKLLRGNA